MSKQIVLRRPVYQKKKATPNKIILVPSTPENQLSDKTGFYLLIIIILTVIAFSPVFINDFLFTWDDSTYITDNLMIRSLDLHSLRQMFTSQIGGTYVPLPLLSYAIEYKFFGYNPLAFHVTNLLIHLCSSLLVFQILRRLRLAPLFATFGALIFGIHPMGVESVVWATERKDLLYSLFYLASLLTYLNYCRKEKHTYYYIGLSYGLFLLALLSKIQAVSLPLVLLLIDYYIGRPLKVKLIAEKIPYFALSLGFGIAGIFILKNVGALKINTLYTLQERFFFGCYAFNAYLIKFVAPFKLSALYPYPALTGQPLPVLYYLSPLTIILLAFAIYKGLKTERAFVFGILFFIFSVVFLLQIFGAGQGFMADRYTKIPYVGLVFITVWYLAQLLLRKKERKGFIFSGMTVFLILFMILTFQRSMIWKNGETLWTDVIDKYPGRDSRPYACRGLYYKTAGIQDKAVADFTTELSIDPNDADILQYRGNIYFGRGKDDSAYSDYIRAIKITRSNALAFANLGAIYVRRNQYDSALINLSKALQMDSSLFTSYANRAVVYGAMGNPEESIRDFKRYLRSKPDDERVMFSIGIIYQNKGEFEESVAWFNKAISVKPDVANYYWIRSQSFRKLGNKSDALKDALKAKDLGMEVPVDYIRSLN